MVIGDIRGEPIPNAFEKTTPLESFEQVAGAGLGLAGAVGGPWLGLLGMTAGFKVLDSGLRVGMGSLRWGWTRAVPTAIPLAKKAGMGVLKTVRPAIVGAARFGSRHPLAAGAIALAGLAGTGYVIDRGFRGTVNDVGLGLAIAAAGGAGLAGALWLGSRLGPYGGTLAGAAIGGFGGAAFSSFQHKFNREREYFAASASGMMARGAAGRSRNQGH